MVDDREGSIIHPDKGEIPTYIFEVRDIISFSPFAIC